MKVTVVVVKDVEIDIDDRWNGWDCYDLDTHHKSSEDFRREIKEQINLPFIDEEGADPSNGIIESIWDADGNTVLFEY